MFHFDELRHHNHLILCCYRSPFAVLSALSVMSTLKNESINFSIKFEEQDFELIIKTNSKNINIGQIGNINKTNDTNNILLNEDVYCSCQKYPPSTYLLYIFLKRHNKLNKDNLWPIIVYFTYKSLYLNRNCDYCIILKEELINEAYKYDIKYNILTALPFFNTMPLIDVLLADIDYCNSIKLFTRNNIDRLYLKLAQQGISIKHAKENYINLNVSTQKLLKDSLPKQDCFFISKDYNSLFAIEYFFGVVYFIEKSLNFNDSFNFLDQEKAFETHRKISEICKINYKNIRKLKNWRILVINLEGELFFYKLVFDAYFKIFEKIGKQFALVIQRGTKNLLITKKDHKWVGVDEFREYLNSLSEL